MSLCISTARLRYQKSYNLSSCIYESYLFVTNSSTLVISIRFCLCDTFMDLVIKAVGCMLASKSFGDVGSLPAWLCHGCREYATVDARTREARGETKLCLREDGPIGPLVDHTPSHIGGTGVARAERKGDQWLNDGSEADYNHHSPSGKVSFRRYPGHCGIRACEAQGRGDEWLRLALRRCLVCR
jgi:hypothetical protein